MRPVYALCSVEARVVTRIAHDSDSAAAEGAAAAEVIVRRFVDVLVYE